MSGRDAGFRRPLVGVTGPDEGGAAAWWFTRFALLRAGARACRITPSRPRGGEGLDGLVLGGGADVAPALYQQGVPSLAEAMAPESREEAEEDAEEAGRGADPEAPRSVSHGWGRRLVAGLALLLRRAAARKSRPSGGDADRDRLELGLLAEVLPAGKPVLGICRGAQLLNVHLGGTLHQDLSDFYVETPQITTLRPRKRIVVEPGSRLADVLRAESCLVNSLHRQAVDRLAPDLRVAARETTGVVQAIEHPDRPFLLGVQWHPEYLPQVRRQRRVFEALVRAARGMPRGEIG
ncbi:MAG TPA: gamma-glutamyl-gamma-aminobutyrate hydrolase family protein [Thermoanaerobaculia bacterium]|nr:gamma-glutamyl-gamma-aminobutyrate hydrolase family protein [Thermoanaerobaculia bacterium]